MILIGENKRFISADHIQDIYIQQMEKSDRHTVTVRLFGHGAVFGKRDNDAMSVQMALELRKRLIKAIVDYKSSDTPEIQYVDLPTREEVHRQEDSETS